MFWRGEITIIKLRECYTSRVDEEVTGKMDGFQCWVETKKKEMLSPVGSCTGSANS